MRTIRINFTVPWMPLRNGCILGYIGEHNATCLSVFPPREMLEENEVVGYGVCFETGGKLIHSPVYDDPYDISVPLPMQLTQNKFLNMQLEGYNRNGQVIMRSELIKGLQFLPSAQGEETGYDRSLSPALEHAFRGFEIVEPGENNAGVTEMNVYNLWPSLVINEGCRVRKINLFHITDMGSQTFAHMTYLEEVTGFENVIFPFGGMFYCCEKLKSVKLNPTLTEIPQQTFYQCNALETLDLPETAETIGSNAFYHCTKLKEIDFAHIRNVSERGFADCTSLRPKNWHSSFNTIGKYAFTNCGSMVIENIKSNSIDSSAFMGCISLRNISVDCPRMGTSMFYKCTGLETVVLTDTTNLSHSMFYGCTALQRVNIPDCTASVPHLCFQECSSLDMERIAVEGSIGQYAFAQTGVTKPVISASSIGEYAFYICANLSEFHLQEGCTSIGNYAFDSAKFKEVSVPKSVVTVGSGAFQTEPNLQTAVIPCISVLNAYVFSGDTALQNAAIGSAEHPITSIHRRAFSNCTQEGLSITVYVNDPTVPLANQPWGATKATVSYLQA